MNGLINRQYVGARYVPKLMGEWNKTLQYEALSIVTYMGNSFTSKIPVPPNIEIDNTNYWVNTGNYNAQVEGYRKEVENLGFVTPEKYGAKGDGVTDDTKAIQMAIDHVKNGCVLFKKTTYCVSETLVISNKNMLFNNCTLKRIADCTVLNFDESNNFTLSDVTITDNGRTYGNMIVGRSCENVEIKNVAVNSTSPHTSTSNGNWAMCLSGNAFHISGLRINNYKSGKWADGLHFGYLTNSFIENFIILSGDDSIAITQHPSSGTDFKNIVSENNKFVNGVLKSAVASPIRLGFDNSTNLEQYEINNCYHKNVTFENIDCEGGFFLRIEYIKHDSTALPISDENIKFININYKQTIINKSYPQIYISKEYSLKNYFFNKCNIDSSISPIELTQPFFYISSNVYDEKSLLSFNECRLDFGNIDGIKGSNINKVKFKNCDLLSNEKTIISIKGSCEFDDCNIINYGAETDSFCTINKTNYNKIYRLNGCYINNYKQFSNKNEDGYTVLFMNDCYFNTTSNNMLWYSGHANYNNIIKGNNKLNSSKDLFIYVPASSSIEYDLSGYTYASLYVLSSKVDTYEVIIRKDGTIMLPDAKKTEATNMLANAGINIAVTNGKLTITNTKDEYQNMLIKYYAQTN